MGLLLFQNEACLVINKLSGESSESPEIKSGEPGAEGEFFQSENFQRKISPVHRLDMPVTGCLLLAKTKEAAAFLSKAFASPANCGEPARVEKRYWAIIEKPQIPGALAEKAELIHWLRENKKVNKSFAFSADEAKIKNEKNLKKAVLRYRLIGEGEHYLFLEIELITGRRHQIRAQLAALGLYIKGDLKYGARRSEKNGGIRLHAYSLAFPNPLDERETIKVEAQPPEMDSLWSAYASSLPGVNSSSFL
jgi:23S rRNA pseudouridine1911/1915/1917 synthase